jgi:hypothetical protein
MEALKESSDPSGNAKNPDFRAGFKRKQMQIRYPSMPEKTAHANYSPTFEVAMLNDAVFEAVEAVFDAADKYKVLGITAPDPKKMKVGELPQAGSARIPQRAITGITQGNLTDGEIHIVCHLVLLLFDLHVAEQKIDCLKKISSGKMRPNAACDYSRQLKAIAMIKDDCLNFIKKLDRSVDTWSHVVAKYSHAGLQNSLGTYIKDYSSKKNAVNGKKNLAAYCSNLVRTTRPRRAQQSQDVDLRTITQQYQSGDIKEWSGEFTCQDVFDITQASVPRRPYSLVIMDPPYGNSVDVWDREVSQTCILIFMFRFVHGKFTYSC